MAVYLTYVFEKKMTVTCFCRSNCLDFRRLYWKFVFGCCMMYDFVLHFMRNKYIVSSVQSGKVGLGCVSRSEVPPHLAAALRVGGTNPRAETVRCII